MFLNLASLLLGALAIWGAVKGSVPYFGWDEAYTLAIAGVGALLGLRSYYSSGLIFCLGAAIFCAIQIYFDQYAV